MNRITSQRQAEEIQQAYSLLPPRIADRVRNVHFFTEDPIFAGLGKYQPAADGRSWGATAHVNYRHHLPHDNTTVVLPIFAEAWIVVHELGHALHESIGFKLDWRIYPVSRYARRNQNEAFAEAFCRWVGLENYRGLPRVGELTAGLFAELAA